MVTPWLETLKKASATSLLGAALFGGSIGLSDAGWDIVPEASAQTSAEFGAAVGGGLLGLSEIGAVAIARRRREKLSTESDEQTRQTIDEGNRIAEEEKIVALLVGQLRDNVGCFAEADALLAAVRLRRLKRPDSVGRFLGDAQVAVLELLDAADAADGLPVSVEDRRQFRDFLRRWV